MSNDVANYLAPADTMEAFVEAVKAKMIRDGVTQVELAKRLGIRQPTLSGKLSLARGNMSFATADEIAKALGTTTLELLTSHF
jgi:transcriptional regulator with XRE-family HTH domain